MTPPNAHEFGSDTKGALTSGMDEVPVMAGFPSVEEE